MKVIAEVSSLHARLPLYNAQTVLELLHFQSAERVLLAGVSATDWASGAWREAENPVWFALEDAGLEVTAVGEDWAWAMAEQQRLLEFLKYYPQGRERLRTLNAAESELRTTLQRPLDTAGVYSQWLEAVRAYHQQVTDVLEEGPGTAHRRQRLERLRERLEPYWGQNAVLIAPLDDVPGLLNLGLQAPQLKGFEPGPASRFRAIVDRAYQLEPEDDLDALVHGLLELDAPADTVLARLALEARFAASGVYLAVADFESARDLLEAVAQGQFERPSYLPGFVLARLGQVRDLMGERKAAIGAYRATLALGYCPSEARAVAESGVREAFQLAS